MNEKRDFLFEAVQICENKSAMTPTKAHLKAIYDAWGAQLIAQHKIKNAILNLAQMNRDGKKLPSKDEIPLMIDALTKDRK